MSSRNLIITMFLGCLLLALVTFGSLVESQGGHESSLRLAIEPEKERYLPGEVVTFTITLTNVGSAPVRFLEHLSPEKGYTHIRIGRNENELDRYVNPKWGRRDFGSRIVTLEPNESISRTLSVLWNLMPSPDASRLSSESVRAAVEDRILHHYAFPEPGKYFVQAATSVSFVTKDGEPPLRILSDVIEIPIEKPRGDDLLFWNSIKDDGGVAYFLQEGDVSVPNFSRTERQRLAERIDELISLHPLSTYNQRLRAQLNSFREKQRKAKN